jgi:hypothetical protein
MAVAIATRINGGFFLEFILFELQIGPEIIAASRREWPHVFKFKAQASGANQARERPIMRRPRRAPGNRRRV